MIADPNIVAKITFNSNNAQFKNIGTQFMLQYSRQSLNNIKLRNKKDLL